MAFDIVSVLICFLVFATTFKKHRVNNLQHRIFLSMLFTATSSSVLEILSTVLFAGGASTFGVKVSEFLYFLSIQFTALLFFHFVLSQMERNKSLSRTLTVLLFFPLVLGLACALIASEFVIVGVSDRIFDILFYALNTLYYLGALVYLFLKRRIFERNFRGIVSLVTVLCVSTEVLQFFLPGLMVQGLGKAFMLLILAMNFEQYGIILDSDTGMASKDVLERTVKKLLYNEKGFDAMLVRVKNYDVLVADLGIDTLTQVLFEVKKYFLDLVGPGYAYQIDDETYVLVETNEFLLVNTIEKIYRRLSDPWNMEKIDYSIDFLATVLTSPENFSEWDTLYGYLQYFQSMQRLSSGVVPLSELSVSNEFYRRRVELAVETGMKNRSFEVFYQPICTAREQHFMTAEALVRLHDPVLGRISPELFIPIAEQTSLILRLGNFVLEEVCQFISTHDMEKLGLEYIELNLSAIQCMQKNLVEIIDATTAAYHVQSRYLCFEITETASASAPAIFTENLELLKKRGYRLALDDFGTGYANLQRMVSTNFDIIKFDKNMIRYFTSEEKLKGAFVTLQRMIAAMGSKVVSEGIETQEQYEFVRNAGSSYIQGYYFSRPLPKGQFVDFLKEKNSLGEDDFIEVLESV